MSKVEIKCRKKMGIWRGGTFHPSCVVVHNFDSFTKKQQKLILDEKMLTVIFKPEKEVEEEIEEEDLFGDLILACRDVEGEEPREEKKFVKGVPRASVLSEIVGRKVSNSERKKAWKAFKEEK